MLKRLRSARRVGEDDLKVLGGLLKVTYNGTQTTNCFVAYDGNGNVAGLINAADGKSVAQYEYGPFGCGFR